MLFKTQSLKYERPVMYALLCHRQYCVQNPQARQEIEVSNENESVYSCNKSGLLEPHRRMLRNEKPYKDPASWIHLTEKYQRKIFGCYGIESGVSPRICFNTNADKISQKRLEDLAENDNILSMIRKHEMEKNKKKQEILQREEDINKKMEKLEHWKQELNAKIAKKEADALAAKEKKERLVEEVRRHFGYKVDPRDERFKEVLEQREKEEKKKQKEAKRKAKEDKLMNKLAGNSKQQPSLKS